MFLSISECALSCLSFFYVCPIFSRKTMRMGVYFTYLSLGNFSLFSLIAVATIYSFPTEKNEDLGFFFVRAGSHAAKTAKGKKRKTCGKLFSRVENSVSHHFHPRSFLHEKCFPTFSFLFLHGKNTMGNLFTSAKLGKTVFP